MAMSSRATNDKSNKSPPGLLPIGLDGSVVRYLIVFLFSVPRQKSYIFQTPLAVSIKLIG